MTLRFALQKAPTSKAKASTVFMVLDIIDIDAIVSTYNAIDQTPGMGRAVEVARDDGLWKILTTGGAATEFLRTTLCITNLGTPTFTAEMRFVP